MLIVGALLARGQVEPPLAAHLTWGQIVLLSLGPQAVLIAVMAWLMRAFARRLERPGGLVALGWAESLMVGVWWTSALWHVVAVLGLGWLDVIRRAIGDRILIDEMLAGAPPVLAIVATWWAYYPIDRLLREAQIIRRLDEGAPIHAPPGRWAFVLMNVRHELLLILAPLTLLAAWSEATHAVLDRLAEAGDGEGVRGFISAWLERPAAVAEAHTGLQVLGMLAVFVLLPGAIGWLWDTTPIGPGPTRERLLDVCRAQRVRVRDLLLWRTRGSMATGALVGLVGRLRYVLLTDALVDALSDRQLEAVMAHEIGHVRRRHVPWLAATLLASVGVMSLLADGVLQALRIFAVGPPGPPGVVLRGVIEVAMLGLALATGLVVFGWVSRRFEWQADAFAVQHLSGLRPRAAGMAVQLGAPSAGPVTISSEAVDAMTSALAEVARLNHIPPEQFSWRHGSIQRRIDNLRRLVGKRAAGLPIDSVAGGVKLLSVLGVLGLIAASALEWWWWGGGPGR